MSRTTNIKPQTFQFQGFATGYHVYGDIWMPCLGEYLRCEREPDNQFDPNAIKIMKGELVVGHVSRQISKWCSYAILSGGRMHAVVSGSPQNKRRNGVEVPVTYHLKGPDCSIGMAKLCINEHLNRVFKAK